ncbi:MAG: dienelactone hydrolase family protein [Gammaproteobacteria bacterium]|nr:dienelactone hydrolase family protein [Gammaproteobacteria bacterium]MDH5344211.1 dienelactone hydrolase family protein [Gammaproteobacteria bacterium]
MCDELTNQDTEAYLQATALTRRAFNRGGTAAALAMLLPPVAGAADIVESDVLVPTPDGEADCYFVHPAEGRHAAVIVWPDIVSIRPAFRAMGKRLAESGYSVLVVNPYYRTHVGQIVPDGKTFRDPGIRDMLMPHAQSLSPDTCVSDGRAFVEWLDAQASVDTDRMIGTTGYCMTGSYVMRLAAAIPDRIGAGGSFHGGGLATEAGDSPHLLARQMKAGFLIAIAENDDERNPGEKVLLREAFDKAGVDAEIEVYAGTLHGWCPPDSAVYNEAQAERAWSRLLALFEQRLA